MEFLGRLEYPPAVTENDAEEGKFMANFEMIESRRRDAVEAASWIRDFELDGDPDLEVASCYPMGGLQEELGLIAWAQQRIASGEVKTPLLIEGDENLAGETTETDSDVESCPYGDSALGEWECDEATDPEGGWQRDLSADGDLVASPKPPKQLGWRFHWALACLAAVSMACGVQGSGWVPSVVHLILLGLCVALGRIVWLSGVEAARRGASSFGTKQTPNVKTSLLERQRFRDRIEREHRYKAYLRAAAYVRMSTSGLMRCGSLRYGDH